MIKLKSLIKQFLIEDFVNFHKQNLPNQIFPFGLFWDRVFKNVVEDEDEDFLKTRYNEEIVFLKSLEGKSCWRELTIPNNQNPVDVNDIGIFWSPDEKDAKAYAGSMNGQKIAVKYEGVINLKNIYWPNTLIVRLHPETDHENELQFVKGNDIFIKKVIINGEQIVDINDKRRM